MNKEMIGISGVSESRAVPIISDLLSGDEQGLIITSSALRAEKLASDLSFFSEKEIILIPAEEQVFLKYEAKNHDTLIERLKALQALRTNPNVIVVVPSSGAIKRMIPHKLYEKSTLKITLGEDIDIEEVKASLVSMGYERKEIVECKGEFSVRGGIIDIFTPEGDNPYRIELFGTEIDSIRSFDVDSQRSLDSISKLDIFPAEELLADRTIFENAEKKIRSAYDAQIENMVKLGEGHEEIAEKLEQRKEELCEYVSGITNIQLLENYVHYFYDTYEYIWNYMISGTVIVEDPDRIYEHLDQREQEIKNDLAFLLETGRAVPEDSTLITGRRDLYKAYETEKVAVITPFNKQVDGISTYSRRENIVSRQIPTFGGRMDFFESELKSYLSKDYKVTICASSKERLENLKGFTDRCGLTEKVIFKEGNLSAGIDYPEEKICIISDNDIFKTSKFTGKRKKKTKSRAIQSFVDMKAGDFVVHENHGIGKFIGIEQLTVQGEQKDYLKIKYAGDDMLYVPVEQMDIVQKYIGSEGKAPKVNKLSGGDWKLTKAKAKAAIAEMATELLEMQAKRSLEKGHAFGEDDDWQRQFEDSFEFEETDDQLRSIEEIKEDMEKPMPMDRLLCGDVGFGKTEVAARAIFKCISQGMQAAVLVPTTILANQHYNTLKKRFSNFPFEIEMMSRFRTDRQQDEIAAKVKTGKIDLVIGTHRLLSSDVNFKNLGLLVIDEEQRFGVAHKEKIKKLKANVDVLTLSATPIPRTLNMSLSGIKDMSLIEEPPQERYPVQTYVMEEDDIMLREIINRELDRGGQVFVVYNRVRGIHKVAENISSLVPDAKVALAHGQMNEHTLEDVMSAFTAGEYNCLVSTTIIETGIDISNANTMIILDADKCGLSQLYQLRGRVGRSNKMAYAYLMYKKNKVLSEVAEKRLRAIKEFTEFGSGFKIAMRDLEIRGAGNLLGSEQSGHMMSIGYELYCKLVDDAMRKAKGEVVNENKEEVTVEFKSTAYIPNWYISNEMLKLQMYKKIAGIFSEDDMEEIIDEMIDRFGELPKETLNLIRISRIRALSEELSVKRIHEQKNAIIVEFAKENPLNPYALMNVNEKFGMRAFVHGGVEPYIKLTTTPIAKLDDAAELLQIIFDNRKQNATA